MQSTEINFKSLRGTIASFSKAKVLVLGDLILDEFIWGKVSRISPEAPVPVVWTQNESTMPGGASNVANNIRALGGRVQLAGIVGEDDGADVLLRDLEELGVGVKYVLRDLNRPTTVKTRVIAHQQQVVRIDREDLSPISSEMSKRIAESVIQALPDVDCIIIEDYGKGVIVPQVLEPVIAEARKLRKIICVDPKEDHLDHYQGVTAITPNRHEAQTGSGVKITDEASFLEAAKVLLSRLHCDSVLLTLGEDGMLLLEENGATTRIPTEAHEVYDVSGAGDTVISVFSLALAAGAGRVEAAYLSNLAAGIVVEKVGVAVVTPEELLKRMETKV
ncbi:MAG: D-glycero-beta-D-manno-heptose-7-phosphate kinase [Candidatus Omnitrophica bacterium]|nr:D-glycero-beta-D-manno-heptose-7-phosphate kinase [Candidatus Omnitrophota bacterium]